MATAPDMPASRHCDALFAALRAAAFAVYGERLTALAVFGSWARGTATPESDLNLLVVAENLPPSRTKRVGEFRPVEAATQTDRGLVCGPSRPAIELTPVFKTSAELAAGSPLYLDMISCFLAGLAATAAACPFCDVVGRPLAERRDAAAVTAVGEAAGEVERAEVIVRQPFLVRGLLRGTGPADDETVVARVAGPVAGTALLFGDSEGGYEAVAADETLLGYVAAAPPVEAAAAGRLGWFARWLEHPNSAIAVDAFLEFGVADYAAVVAAAGSLDAGKLGAWLVEPDIDERRRGFYGLALGIVAARARELGDEAQAEACTELLERVIAAPAGDLRAGYDGLLGGLIVARGPAALVWLEAHGLLAADTRAGDARHALAALRFGWEFLGDTVPREEVAAAAAGLLDNPAVAAETAVDLARWQHWESVADVAALWKRLGRDDPLVRRAVAGYLTACPLPEAKQQAGSIAAAEPAAWAAAVAAAGLPPRGAE